ncbi:MAG: transketolase [Actinobacteria bacterium]|nr:transketolase [Actinomycetota bacterium]
MENHSIKNLDKIANLARQNIIKVTTEVEGGHLAGSLSCIDILVVLYFKVLSHNPAMPDWDERDRFILSKGHAAPALYTVLAMSGYFPEEELYTLRKINSRLQGHPDSKKLPGIEISTGSLGQGFSAAVGMALGYKYDKKNGQIYCLVGDGECDEGQVWEAAMFASSYNIKNITVIIDRNRYQIDGETEKVIKLEPLKDKWNSFGWETMEIDGHNLNQIQEALEKARGTRTVIIANTIKGKGVSFLENNNKYHSKPCCREECSLAIDELNKKLEFI